MYPRSVAAMLALVLALSFCMSVDPDGGKCEGTGVEFWSAPQAPQAPSANGPQIAARPPLSHGRTIVDCDVPFIAATPVHFVAAPAVTPVRSDASGLPCADFAVAHAVTRGPPCRSAFPVPLGFRAPPLS